MHCILVVIFHFIKDDTWLYSTPHAVLTADEERSTLEMMKEDAKDITKSPAIDIVRIIRFTQGSVVWQIQG